jgi:hypothetical protein
MNVIHALDERLGLFIRDKPMFSLERILHTDYEYYRKGSVVKK